jgi:hypothetical protein
LAGRLVKLLAPRFFVEPVAQGPPKHAQEFLPNATANAAGETGSSEKWVVVRSGQPPNAAPDPAPFSGSAGVSLR